MTTNVMQAVATEHVADLVREARQDRLACAIGACFRWRYRPARKQH